MRTFLVLLFAVLALAQNNYPGHPECGWSNEQFRAVGDWAVDAGSPSNWNAAEPKGVMTATYKQNCEYAVQVSGLTAGKSYTWKVTIAGEKTGFQINWGCSGMNANPCQFTAPSSGTVVFSIVASVSYPLTVTPVNGGGATSQASASSVVPPATSSGGNTGRFVFAHYMLGFADGSDEAFFDRTIKTAMSAGIDGFAVNLGADGWQPAALSRMFAAVSNNQPFKLFISFDMDSIGANPGLLTAYINKFANHPSYYRYQGRPFVSTFAGQWNNLGLGGTPNEGWTNWKKNQVGSFNIYFCPAFTPIDPNQLYNDYSVIDCAFSWDVFGATSSAARDSQYIAAAKRTGKTFMAGVAPWFYCHLPEWQKNWVWPPGVQGSEELWSMRWNQVIQNPPNFVEIVTWNDYSESSYIAPLQSDVPGFAGPYVYNPSMDHKAWFDMAAKYYIPWYKSGNRPQVKENQVYWWYRIHGRYQSRNDQYPAPDQRDHVQDCVTVHAISGTFNTTIEVNVNGRVQKLLVKDPEQSICVPYNGAGPVTIRVLKGGKTYTPSNFGPNIQTDGNIYNFNAWTGSFTYPL